MFGKGHVEELKIRTVMELSGKWSKINMSWLLQVINKKYTLPAILFFIYILFLADWHVLSNIYPFLLPALCTYYNLNTAIILKPWIPLDSKYGFLFPGMGYFTQF